MERILKSFYTAHYDRILITKTDESHSLGTALSAVYKTDCPISYITTGQEVPNDTVLCPSNTMAAQLVKRRGREVLFRPGLGGRGQGIVSARNGASLVANRTPGPRL